MHEDTAAPAASDLPSISPIWFFGLTSLLTFRPLLPRLFPLALAFALPIETITRGPAPDDESNDHAHDRNQRNVEQVGGGHGVKTSRPLRSPWQAGSQVRQSRETGCAGEATESQRI